MLPISRRKPHARRAARRAVWTALALAAVACGETEVPVVEGVIDRETFIQVYVDLRAAAVDNEDLAITESERDSILVRHGVDRESLLAFVDAYGTELDYMNELWAEVERRIEALSPPAEEESGV